MPREPVVTPDTHVRAADGIGVALGDHPGAQDDPPEFVLAGKAFQLERQGATNDTMPEADCRQRYDLPADQLLLRPVGRVRQAGELLGGQEFCGGGGHASPPQSTKANSLLNNNTWAYWSHRVAVAS